METIEDVRNQPQNLVRKLFALTNCVTKLQTFQTSYRPIFEDDPGIASLLEHLHAERESLMIRIRQHPDYLELIEKQWEEQA